ncbi:MAG: MFS transporter, partial [Proteobacteria bacterium]|nr:MFS transporter [Pseudomonadota bacterium]
MSGDEADRGAGSLSPLQKAVFGLGDHTVGAVLSALSLIYAFYLPVYAGLRPELASLVVWIPRLIDAVTDPLMGRISDRTTWQAGRRRPYFLLGAIPFGVFFALLWFTPFESQAAKFIYHISMYIGVSLSMTVLSVPYLALLPEMARDYDERTSLNTYRSAAAVLGTFVAVAMQYVAPSLGEGSRGYVIAGCFLAIWLTVP